MTNLDIRSVEDIDKFSGKYYTDKLASFYDEFKKAYGDDPTTVHPIVYTAFIILGKDASQLTVDPYME